MEKKSALIGGGIGLAIGMASMFGLVMGIGSCASSQNVKKVNPDSVLAQRPKMATDPVEEPVLCYRVSTLKSTGDVTGLSDGLVVGSIYESWYNGGTGQQYLIGNQVVVGAGVGTYSLNYTTSTSKTLATISESTGNLSGSSSVFYVMPNGNYDFLAWYDNVDYGALTYSGRYSFEVLPEPTPEPVTGGLISDIFQQVGESISKFAMALGDSVGQAVALFYDGNGFSPLGILTLVSGGIALVYWTLYLIKKMLNIGVK